MAWVCIEHLHWDWLCKPEPVLQAPVELDWRNSSKVPVCGYLERTLTLVLVTTVGLSVGHSAHADFVLWVHAGHEPLLMSLSYL